MAKREAPLPRPFLLVGAECAGATLLGRWLLARGDVALAGELLNLDDLDAGRIQWLPDQPDETEELCRLRREAPFMLLDRLHNTAHEREARAVGFRLLYRHAQQFQRVTDHLIGLHVDVIHLRRRDRVGRLAATLASERAGVQVSARQERRPGAEPVRLEPARCAQDFAEVAHFEFLFSRLFHASRRLSIDYEDLLGDWEGQVQRVQRFMGLDPVPSIEPVEPTPQPATRELVANWDELAGHFHGSRWAGLFEG